jgi:hypothetical protein
MSVDANAVTAKDSSGQMYAQIEGIFQLLNQKEKLVLEKRFAINREGRFTLAEIGNGLSVTRERIRQIEKCALQKIRRNIQNYPVYEMCENAYKILKESGGIMREDILVSKLLKQNVDTVPGLIQLVLSSDVRYQRNANTLKFHPYLRLTKLTDELVEKVCSLGGSYLKEKGETVDLEKISADLKKKVPDAELFETVFFRSLFETHKDFKLVENFVGLIEWRNINPRTLRDKIYFVLRRKKEPLHFMDISNLIVDAQLDRKNVNMQAVHNELIRNDDFILIGRGIYALKEWGYDQGTVSDVIAGILGKRESMSEEEIIQEVLKVRQVKAITIILNLKNKPQFVRVGRKQYKLK